MSKTAYIFPGQGAQFVGMGKELYDNYPIAKELFEKANEVLGFKITDIIFRGTEEELKETKVTQPAIFLHSSIAAICLGEKFQADMVAGHSLGEFSALVAIGVLSFEDGLRLVSKRAMAMQKACQLVPSTMAAILGLEDNKVIEVLKTIENEVVIAANFNCPGQVVISGSIKGVEEACAKLKEAGAKRALPLKVSGAFHSPFMESAREELSKAIEETKFSAPSCPIYQNVTASAVTSAEEIKKNLIAQLTAPVRWTESVQAMVQDEANKFIEVGPGNILQGLVKKIDRSVETEGIS